MAKKQEPEVQQQAPKLEAPQTKAFLLKQLNNLESNISEARSKINELDEKISRLQGDMGMWEGQERENMRQREELLALFKEVGGQEWEITGN